MKTRHAIAAATITTLALAFLTPTAANAAPAPRTDIFALAVTDRHGNTEAVLLTCQPAGGTHPDARAACRAINRADGNLHNLKGLPDLVCTLEYDPVTATAIGRYNGNTVLYSERFSNPCVLKRHTHPVFSFAT